MKKLITLLLTTMATLSIVNAADNYNGWTSELVQKTFPELIGSKDKKYTACFLNVVISNFTPNAYNALLNKKKLNTIFNPALQVCGFPNKLTSYKEKMDKDFHGFVNAYAKGTEQITAEFPKTNNANSLGVQYDFTWVNKYGEQKIDIYYCWIGDAQGYASDDGSFSCTDNYPTI